MMLGRASSHNAKLEEILFINGPSIRSSHRMAMVNLCKFYYNFELN